MKKRTIITLSTVLGWSLIVALFAREYVLEGISHPEALEHIPTDYDAVALQKLWWIQLIGFALVRFPLFLVALVLVLFIERRMFPGGTKREVTGNHHIEGST